MDGEEPWVVFGEVLKRLRIERKLSQAQLGKRSGVDQTYISFLERGLRQPTLPTLYGLCGALDITLSELINELEDNF